MSKEGTFHSCGGPGAKMCQPIEGQTILQIPRFGGSGPKMLQNAGFQDHTTWWKPARGRKFFTTSESCQVMLCEMGDKIMEEELRPEKHEFFLLLEPRHSHPNSLQTCSEAEASQRSQPWAKDWKAVQQKRQRRKKDGKGPRPGDYCFPVPTSPLSLYT